MRQRQTGMKHISYTGSMMDSKEALKNLTKSTCVSEIIETFNWMQPTLSECAVAQLVLVLKDFSYCTNNLELRKTLPQDVCCVEFLRAFP